MCADRDFAFVYNDESYVIALVTSSRARSYSILQRGCFELTHRINANVLTYML
jgi:hypothetical protein